MIVAGPDILAELGINARILNNVLVIDSRGCRISVSARQFQSFTFPGLNCFEARLITRGEGEIIINRSIIVPVRDASVEDVACIHGRLTSMAMASPAPANAVVA
jgi:hypothetical protein